MDGNNMWIDQRRNFVRTFLAVLLAACPAGAYGRSGKAPAQKTDAVYNQYLMRLRNQAQAGWDYVPGQNHVVLQATVNADGTVAGSSLTSLPPNEAAEEAARRAFAKCQPLAPLPATVAVRLSLIFDSSYDPHGDSSSSVSARIDPLPDQGRKGHAQGGKELP